MSFLKGLKHAQDFRSNAQIKAYNQTGADTTLGIIGALPLDFANLPYNFGFGNNSPGTINGLTPAGANGNLFPATNDDVYQNVVAVSATNIGGILVSAQNPTSAGVITQAANGGKPGFWGLQGKMFCQFGAAVTVGGGSIYFAYATAGNNYLTAATLATIQGLGHPIGVVGVVLTNCTSGTFPNNLCLVDFDGEAFKKALK